MNGPILLSILCCPQCGHCKEETMPTDACQFFYQCEACGTLLRPLAGDCCVFCSYGTTACPPKQIDGAPASRVTALSHCADGYKVTTADGKTRTFWEFNMRFKTDGSADGPALGHPVIVGNGIRGDRAHRGR